ncbi:hypothetical protein C8J57DRAFT_193826 [Mycena rebaudengoi]|nr:hypothetical protein C8J57DRAFT_193826 [Mycena rebaudengoi]
MSSRWAQTRNRVAELNILIDDLVAERKYLQAELDSIVYPVLTIPSEITSHIFSESIPADSNASPSRHIAPLLLTQICRLWRAIALATPSLWQSIRLAEVREQHNNGSGELLEMWLKNSSTLPLSLSFAVRDSGRAQSLIDASLVHHHRLLEISVTSEGNLEASDKALPILRKVTFYHWGRAVSRAVNIGDAPMLQEAHLRFTNPITDIDIQIPWAQLTRLTLETFDFPAVCLPMLSQCSELLSHLTHNSILHDEVLQNTFSLPHITLEHLDSLSAAFIGPSLVPHLTLPRLRQLSLSRKINSAIEPIRALLSRSSCELQKLSIDVTKVKRPRLEELLLFFELVPSVTDLRFTSPEIYLIIGPLSSTAILPLLQYLTIQAERVGPGDNYDVLLALLRSRIANGTLKSFDLILRPHSNPQSPSDSSPFPEIVMAQFRDLANAGLKIRIRLYGSVILNTFTC